MKKDIENRADIALLMETFYTTIRADEMLGPIFNNMISPSHWPAHLEKIADFWETNLFGVPKFKGNPTLSHIITDNMMDNKMSKAHFDHWLSIWFATIDSLFEGQMAERAKSGAQNIASIQLIKIVQQRPTV